MNAPELGPRRLGVPTAAVALACSWCWVIGMVFPLFMIMDFGWLGWVVFVVPNVIGAASVGFVLRSRAHAEGFLETHRHAIRAFSWVTIAFHGFVIAWLGMSLGVFGALERFIPTQVAQIMVFTLLPGALVMLAAWRFSRRPTIRAIAGSGWVVLFASALCFPLAQLTTSVDALAMPPSVGDFPRWMVLFALTGTSLGFLTCPFLDVTFLRVRAELDEPSRARPAFVIAFGLPFLALVAMTAFYATGFNGWSFNSDYIVAHIAFQSAFTVGFHAWALRRMPRTSPAGARSSWYAFWIGVAGAMAWLFVLWARPRLGYEVIISAYVLPFPAYVWIVCVWAKRPTRRSMAAWGITCVAAAPLFTMGYLMAYWALVPAGVAVVLAGPLLLRVLPGQRRESTVNGSGS